MNKNARESMLHLAPRHFASNIQPILLGFRVEERIAERIAGWEEVDIDEFLEVLFARLQSSKNR